MIPEKVAPDMLYQDKYRLSVSKFTTAPDILLFRLLHPPASIELESQAKVSEIELKVAMSAPVISIDKSTFVDELSNTDEVPTMVEIFIIYFFIFF